MRGHIYTKEQDEFIRNNYSSVGECVRKFNEQFKTHLSYGAIKTHAFKRLKLTTNFRPWTEELNNSLSAILKEHPYKEATELFNKKHGTAFTVRQIQTHCTHVGIKREHRTLLNQVDKIISENIEKSYVEIREKVNGLLPTNYPNENTICRRANNLGLSRPRRVWDNQNDKRTINGIEVSFSEYVRFIGNRWHRLPIELHQTALSVVKLQALTKQKLDAGEGNYGPS